jgi:hypothetical protein
VSQLASHTVEAVHRQNVLTSSDTNDEKEEMMLQLREEAVTH